MRKFFLKAKVIIGHNITRWDVPTVERLLGIKVTAKIVDTLALSWILYPDRNRHGLESWGEDLGRPKPKINDWEGLSYEEYEHRCSEDVEINRQLWNKIFRYLFDLYGNNNKIWEYLDYVSFKMHCARLQEQSGWHVDIDLANKTLQDLNTEKEEKVVELAKVMPKVPKYKIHERPLKFFKKDGSYSSLGLKFLQLLTENGLPADTQSIRLIDHYVDPNPSSPDQVKNWLYDLGWVPETHKTVKDKKTGELRFVPQINLDQGKGICPSIKKLYDKEPRLEVLDGLSVISHRLGVIKGIINGTDPNTGKTMAQIQGLTNTLRFQHTTVVNLPKPNKPYAEGIRGSLISPPGYILCGADMASLEDRIKQHFIFEYDPEYVRSMNSEDFDPHLTVAGLAGMLTQDEIDGYRQEEKRLKPIRDIAKNGNYACQYGAGVPRLMITCGISREAAERLHKAYWKLNWAVKKIASVQSVKHVHGDMWLLNPINGFYYSLRQMKDVFSTLVQGTASYVFDLWVQYIIEERPQLTGQFHDEIILCIKEGFEEKCSELVTKAIDKLNSNIKLNRELGISIQFNQRYSGIH